MDFEESERAKLNRAERAQMQAIDKMLAQVDKAPLPDAKANPTLDVEEALPGEYEAEGKQLEDLRKAASQGQMADYVRSQATGEPMKARKFIPRPGWEEHLEVHQRKHKELQEALRLKMLKRAPPRPRLGLPDNPRAIRLSEALYDCVFETMDRYVPTTPLLNRIDFNVEEVEVSRDLREATIIWTADISVDTNQVNETLSRFVSRIKADISRNVPIKYMPEISFSREIPEEDDQIDELFAHDQAFLRTVAEVRQKRNLEQPLVAPSFGKNARKDSRKQNSAFKSR
eukprot:GILK01015909.1.p1 GENE.GILK01015909.1~~GILK01015909.1.p1  ORF type:complete len:286 (-),score=58.50 GILK01015909.1:51-908(-)